MNAPAQWINRGLARLKGEDPDHAKTPLPAALRSKVAERSTGERLAATLRRGEECLSPMALRRVLAELQGVIGPRVSEVEGGRRAAELASWHTAAEPGERRDFWLLLCEQFAPDAARYQAARDHYEAALGTATEAQTEMALRKALTSPRTRLLQRFAAAPDGVRFLIELRAELLRALKGDKRLAPLDAELEQLFSTWFDLAFLELRRLSWDSPASLIEKLIKYEAVHDIRSWADLKNRLAGDRRCYGFFHPRLPNEPLIFVEVALVEQLSDSIAPLLDESAEQVPLTRATTAIFYSISNTQPGLRGVSFGDSLIKHVVETLGAECPRLRQFATLSPIPGFRAWLAKNAQASIDRLDDKKRTELARSLGLDGAEQPTAAGLLSAADACAALEAQAPLAQWLQAAAARYLALELSDDRPVDPVARFHLGNGARVERINWAGDRSAKGHKQSYGLMVNYLYDPKRIDKNRSQLAEGKLAASRDVEKLAAAG